MKYRLIKKVQAVQLTPELVRTSINNEIELLGTKYKLHCGVVDGKLDVTSAYVRINRYVTLEFNWWLVCGDHLETMLDEYFKEKYEPAE